MSGNNGRAHNIWKLKITRWLKSWRVLGTIQVKALSRSLIHNRRPDSITPFRKIPMSFTFQVSSFLSSQTSGQLPELKIKYLAVSSIKADSLFIYLYRCPGCWFEFKVPDHEQLLKRKNTKREQTKQTQSRGQITENSERFLFSDSGSLCLSLCAFSFF